MSYNIKVSPNFKKAFKSLRKRYKSIDSDLFKLIESLTETPK